MFKLYLHTYLDSGFLVIHHIHGDHFLFAPTSYNLGNNVNLKGLGTISLLLTCHTVSVETWKSLQFIFCFLPFALPNLTTVSFPRKIKFQSIPPTKPILLLLWSSETISWLLFSTGNTPIWLPVLLFILVDKTIKYELEQSPLKPIFKIRMDKVPNELSLGLQWMTEREGQKCGDRGL